MLAVDCIWKKNYLIDGNHSINISSRHCGTHLNFLSSSFISSQIWIIYTDCTLSYGVRANRENKFGEFSPNFLNHSALSELRVHISQFHESKIVGNIFIVEILLKSQCCPHSVSRWGTFTQEHLFLLFFAISHWFNSEVYYLFLSFNRKPLSSLWINQNQILSWDKQTDFGTYRHQQTGTYMNVTNMTWFQELMREFYLLWSRDPDVSLRCNV